MTYRWLKALMVICAITLLSGTSSLAQNRGRPTPTDAQKSQEKEEVKGQHATIGVEIAPPVEFARTNHPDAQWFPDAGFGLFIHWGISSVRGMNISWPMIPGRPLARSKLTAEERDRVVRGHVGGRGVDGEQRDRGARY